MKTYKLLLLISLICQSILLGIIVTTVYLFESDPVYHSVATPLLAMGIPLSFVNLAVILLIWKRFSILTNSMEQDKHSSLFPFEPLDKEHFCRVVDKLPIPISLTRISDGLILYANAQTSQMLGLSASELIGHHTTEFYYNPEERLRLMEVFRRDKQIVNYEIQLIRQPDRLVKWFALFLQPLTIGPETMLLGVFYDITVRKQSEAELARFSLALQASETKYRTLFDRAHDAIFIMDDNKIIDFNYSTLTLFNCTREQFFNKTPSELSPPLQPDGQPSEQKVSEKIAATLADEPQRFEWLHIKGDGTPFFAEISLNLIELNDKHYIQAIVRDLTAEHQRLEQEKILLTQKLRNSEERFQIIAETVPVPMIIQRSDDAKVVYVNEQASVTFGLPTSEWIGRHIQDFYLTAAEWQEISHLLTQHGFIYDYEIQMKRNDGSPIWVSLFSQPTLFENEPVMVNTIYDITDRKRAEAERQNHIVELGALNAILTEFNKAYERFVPYEFLQLLGKENVVEVKLGDQVEREMTILFSDIRGFTALSEKMSPPENFYFINQYLGKMAPVITEHRGFIDKYIGDAIMALFPTNADDAVHCGIVMLNKLAEYNQTRQTQALPLIAIGIGLNTGTLMLGTVGDAKRMEGTVISDAVNLASRVEGLTKTYGAALIITEYTYQKLRQPLAYKIRVLDRVTVKGKTQPVTIYEVFEADSPATIELKLKTLHYFEQGVECFHKGQFDKARDFFQNVLQEHEQDKAAQIYILRCQEQISLTMPGSSQILIVDDTPFNVKLLSHLLTSHKYKVLTASNGNSALKIAELTQPDLILLDVMMPGIDGFETCRQLKTNPNTQEIPVIFMTALSETVSKATGFELGAVDYITKPFETTEALARIKVHLRLRQQQLQLKRK